MVTLLRSDTRKMYSWWWDSHISPKNSKWLLENLTDMDAKVKQMIKLIEVDEDSFARRAEMYYKKRPELMKLVEEFYRAYRSLAERYDHATGVIRQAHHTMAEVFPNQSPSSPADDDSPGSVHDAEPQTPFMLPHAGVPFEPDELHGDAMGISPSDFHSGKRNSIDLQLARRKDSKQFSKILGAEGRVKKGLNFHDVDERESRVSDNQKHHLKARGVPESENFGKADTDIQVLKDALAKLEAEKLAGLLQYQQSLKRLSNLESEVSCAQEDSKGYSERAIKAESEVSTLKEALAKLEAEKEASLLQYQQCLDRISNLEITVSHIQEGAGELSTRACKAEKEAEDLKEELALLKVEKETELAKYVQALDKIANLENKLLLAEHDASTAGERADKAEKEVEALREAIAKLTEEKEALALQQQLYLEKIAYLEHEILRSQGEAERLRSEIDAGVAKLKGAEEQCILLETSNKSMQLELDTLLLKFGAQSEDLSEKQKELERLWASVQEERMRFAEAEAAFQAIQRLHSQSREELRYAAAELQKRVELLKEIELQNEQLSSEVESTRGENKSLNEVNLSAAMSIKTMQEEIFNLREGKRRLEEELELRLDQGNALQQEIYYLKEEINDLSKRHGAVLDQVVSLGLNPKCFGSSVGELQDENLKLKESCQRNEIEITALLKKLAVMENLIERNASLESSLSNLSSELEEAREKVKTLEESFQLLIGEKSTVHAEKATLISQLAITSENLERLSERNTRLENSISDANAELEALRMKSKNLEDSCRLLTDEKSVLVSERQTLSLQLETSHRSLEELGKQQSELEQQYSLLEEEREAALRIVEELRASLDAIKQEHANSNQLSLMQMANMEKQIRLLQESGRKTREELEAELDKAVNAQFEIFILRKYVMDLKENNSSLLIKFEKVLEEFRLSEKLISELEHEKLDQQLEIRLLTDQLKRLRIGMFQFCQALEVDPGLECEDIACRDQIVLLDILRKLDDKKRSLSKALDENEKLVVEKSVLASLLEQLKREVADWKAVVNSLSHEFKSGNEKLSFLQKDMQKLLESNEELILRVREGNQREELHAAEIESLRRRLLDMQLSHQNLESINHIIIKEKGTLLRGMADLEQEKLRLEDENSHLTVEGVALDSLTVTFRNIILEKSTDIEVLTETVQQLYNENNALQEKVRTVEGRLDQVHGEKTSLEVSLSGSENELKEVIAAKSQLEVEIENARHIMSRMEREFLDAEAMIDNQGKQMLALFEKYYTQVKDCELLQESIQILDAEVTRVNKQHEEAEGTLETLGVELQKMKDEAELWETVAGTLFGELQSSSVRELLLNAKLFELNEACKSLEDANHFNGVEMVELREKVGKVEGENLQMKAEMEAFLTVISPLRDCVASLENHTTLQNTIGFEEEKDAESWQKGTGDKVSSEPAKIADLKHAHTRIKAVEKAVVAMKRLAEEEKAGYRTNLEAAMKQIEAMMAQNDSLLGSVRSSQHFLSHEELGYGTTEGWRQRKLGSDAHETEVNELWTKDIMLDKASEISFCGKHRRELAKTDNDLLELWETMEKDGSRDLTVGKSQWLAVISPKKYPHFNSRSARTSIESLVEKEMCIDREGISKRFSDPPREENPKKKILERLDSDRQRLNNLQITMQDLKKKVQVLNHSSKGNGTEYDSTKGQLVEAEKTILKLLDLNSKLLKNVELSSSSYDSLSTVESSEGGGSARRARVWEQAGKCSEKIGRLQVEMQKIQFLLMKVYPDQKASRGGGRVVEWDTRVLLRDYLYGGLKTPRRRKKVRFCGLVRPPTRGD